MSLPLLSSEELQAFLTPFTQIPVFSGIDTDLALTLSVDIAVGLFQRDYYVVRFFPALTEDSAEALKAQYAEKIQDMVTRGEDVSDLPVSLDDMRSRNAREFNCFPIWRLDGILPLVQEHQGYRLSAIRYMPDPALSIPSVMLSFEKPGARNIDIVLLTVSITPQYSAILQTAQALSDQQAAIQEVENLEAAQIHTPTIELPDSRRSPGGLILGAD